ncbi:translation initiation factor IF-3 [candidate division KSB1 bacterium]|nr:translation initiation factor IF-3 [candidate division KSB1 bacterium]
MRVNEQIRTPQVRVITHDGQQVGVVTIQRAMDMAIQAGLDLVEVSSKTNPPVCKIMDFGKYKYELSKKEKSVRKKQQTIHVKEIRLRPKIEGHDYEFKMKHARKFLEDGDKVKITVIFRGRELKHLEFGKELLEKIEKDLSDIAKVERPAQVEGRNMILLMTKK